MKYNALFVIFEKSSKVCNRRLLQIIGGTLWVILHLFQSFPPVTEAMEFASMSNTDIFSSQKGEFECASVSNTDIFSSQKDEFECFYVKYRHL